LGKASEVIELIALLVLLLYYYRPQKLDKETAFKEALYWSEWGKACFIGQIILVIALSIILLFFAFLRGELSIMAPNELITFPFNWKDPGNILINLFLYIPPPIFAWLAQRKLVKPLKEEKVPSRKWSLLLSIMGLFSGLIIGFLVLGLADEKIKYLAKSSTKVS